MSLVCSPCHSIFGTQVDRDNYLPLDDKLLTRGTHFQWWYVLYIFWVGETRHSYFYILIASSKYFSVSDNLPHNGPWSGWSVAVAWWAYSCAALCVAFVANVIVAKIVCLDTCVAAPKAQKRYGGAGLHLSLLCLRFLFYTRCCVANCIAQWPQVVVAFLIAIVRPYCIRCRLSLPTE